MEYLKDELRTDISANIKLLQKSNEEMESRIKKNMFQDDSLTLPEISRELKVRYPELLEAGMTYNF